MHEVCFCGWQGETTSRTIVYGRDGELGLACPNCGRLDPVAWISGHARDALFAEARMLTAELSVPDVHRAADLVAAGCR